MIDKVAYLIFFIVIINVLIFTRIFMSQFYKRKRKNEEIIRINRNLYNFIDGFAWLLLLIIFFSLFFDSSYKLYYLLNKGYINSIFQLLDVEYLEILRKHFVENNMLNELITIVHYKNNLVRMLLEIFGSLACSILYICIEDGSKM
ncbi:hypothetical protein E4K67_13645 [Desulfosporosinus fructosivorans]|uniref:Uncharacterized protein n=1 Tax=Desulfosporosinus fructosivorans TaxID=2018669 RepID=A0A4Z0R3Z0_9FIRM|nr:hypothetical protein [Desulfosporosinus fructosivorans]TGE37752.1 hypothetical protein E4K67_13645 [Desulfosporosinus fructosivorans]